MYVYTYMYAYTYIYIYIYTYIVWSMDGSFFREYGLTRRFKSHGGCSYGLTRCNYADIYASPGGILAVARVKPTSWENGPRSPSRLFYNSSAMYRTLGARKSSCA